MKSVVILFAVLIVFILSIFLINIGMHQEPVELPQTSYVPETQSTITSNSDPLLPIATTPEVANIPKATENPQTQPPSVLVTPVIQTAVSNPPQETTYIQETTYSQGPSYPIPEHIVPVYNDPIVGKWQGSHSVFFVYSGETLVKFKPNHTAHVSGSFHGPGVEKSINTDFTWKNLGNGTYRGTYNGKSLDFTLGNSEISMIINPAKMKVSELIDMDITFKLTRI